MKTTPLIKTVPLDSISPDPANVRRHSPENIAAIKASLRRFGQQKPIVVDRNNIIRAGNGSYQAARELGWSSMDVLVTDLSGPDAIAYAIADIVFAAARAGATFAEMSSIRLPYAVKDLFVTWLHQHLPERAGKVLARIRDIRGGKLNDPNFHSRMEGQGIFAQQMHGLFAIACRKAGIPDSSPRINTQAFRRPGGQGSLFQGMGSK